MDSRQRADVSTSTLFSESREKEEQPKKKFGYKDMNEYVKIEWPDGDADEKDTGKERTDVDKS